MSFSLSSLLIELRNIETDLTTKSTSAIIYRKESLVVEVKDDTKDTFVDSIGFATYSNSRATVLSYVYIFEFLEAIRTSKETKRVRGTSKRFCLLERGCIGIPQQSIYSASKHDVFGMTKSAALEYAKYELNAIAPSVVETEMLERVSKDNKQLI